MPAGAVAIAGAAWHLSCRHQYGACCAARSTWRSVVWRGEGQPSTFFNGSLVLVDNLSAKNFYLVMLAGAKNLVVEYVSRFCRLLLYRLIGLSLQVNSWAGLYLENKHNFAKSGSVKPRGYPFPVA